MKIPKRFKLLGHTYYVIETPGEYYHLKRFGSCCFEAKTIKLQLPSPDHPITQSSLEHTFLHELVHHILYYSGKNKALNDDEEFVDVFSGLLHQALTTMEYEENDKKG